MFSSHDVRYRFFYTVARFYPLIGVGEYSHLSTQLSRPQQIHLKLSYTNLESTTRFSKFQNVGQPVRPAAKFGMPVEIQLIEWIRAAPKKSQSPHNPFWPTIDLFLPVALCFK
jgi:hypothetical protein